MTWPSKRVSILVIVALAALLIVVGGEGAVQTKEHLSIWYHQGPVVLASGGRTASTQGPPVPLPRDCDAVTPGGGPPPACCVYGYVYYTGEPVTGAHVTIRSAHGSINLTTAQGSLSSYPYYAASLEDAPLSVAIGEIITVTGTYSETGGTRVHQVVARGQQVDLVCRPILVPDYKTYLPVIVKSK